jgi:tetratricopeptide (TPR) repeat protein
MWFLLLAFLAQSADFQADGLKALDANKFEDAAALFSKAVAADPKDYGAHFNLALAYSMLGRDADAIPEYKTVLELHPGLYEAEMNLGVSLLQTKDAAAAIPHLQAAAQQKPKEFRPAFYLGEALFANRQFPEAESAYTTALALDPTSAPSELGLGRAMARQAHLADAAPHYRKAGTLDPSYKDALLELASLYEDNHQSPEAIAIYREFPSDPRASQRVGSLLLESGNAADAIPRLEAAVAQNPTNVNRLQLAQAYAREKQPAKAEPLAALAVAAAPEDTDVRMFYARLLRDQRKFAEAAIQFVAVAKTKPDLVVAWNELAGVYMISEKYVEALSAYDQVRALGAETNANFFFRGLACDRLNQPKDALENYNRFLAGSLGANPNQEFQARQRVKTLERELGKR